MNRKENKDYAKSDIGIDCSHIITWLNKVDIFV